MIVLLLATHLVSPQLVFLMAAVVVYLITLAAGLDLRLPKRIEVIDDLSKAALAR